VNLRPRVMSFGVSSCSTGPGPVFRDYWGLFGPFWARRDLPENHQECLILVKNQALSRVRSLNPESGSIPPASIQFAVCFRTVLNDQPERFKPNRIR
jgi:hypothetical protein